MSTAVLPPARCGAVTLRRAAPGVEGDGSGAGRPSPPFDAAEPGSATGSTP
ncbi:hypothetical protein [Iamia sp.]|uniref:hypothetical protein n=1 Tax=Iamia sp. TaxID=2722710 RepID=UPI002C139F14|nr:hypothetical protein [Iamia sp.]HXH58435.1 hypothetical protein [Iamia sp.]